MHNPFLPSNESQGNAIKYLLVKAHLQETKMKNNKINYQATLEHLHYIVKRGSHLFPNANKHAFLVLVNQNETSRQLAHAIYKDCSLL